MAKTLTKKSAPANEFAIVAMNKSGSFEWVNGTDNSGQFKYGTRRAKYASMDTRELKAIIDTERDEYGWEFFLDILEDVKQERPMSFIVKTDTKLSALKGENIATRMRGELARIRTFYRRTAKTTTVGEGLLSTLNDAVRGLDRLIKADTDTKSLGEIKAVTDDYSTRLEFAAISSVSTDTHTVTYAAIRLEDVYTEMTKHKELKSLVPAKSKWGLGAAKKVKGFDRAKYTRVINNTPLTFDDVKAADAAIKAVKVTSKPITKAAKSKARSKASKAVQGTLDVDA